MGSNYSTLNTQDPSELRVLNNDCKMVTNRSIGLQRTNRRFSSTDNVELPKIRRSMSHLSAKSPLIQPAVHTDAIGILAPVRPELVISGGRDKLIALNNVNKGRSIFKWNGHEKEITKLVYKNTNGKHFLLSGSRDQTVRLWKFNCASPIQTFIGHEMAVMGVVALDDITCISGSRDTTLKSWDINTAKNTRTVEHSRNVVTHMSYNKARNILVQTSEDKQLKIWDPRELRLIHEFAPKFQILKHCDISPDGNYCITSSSGTNGNGCEVTLYDIRQQKLVREFKGHEESVNCAVFLPQQLIQKMLMLSISADSVLKIWDVDRGGCLSSQLVPVNVELLSCVAFNDGKVLCLGIDGFNNPSIHEYCVVLKIYNNFEPNPNNYLSRLLNVVVSGGNASLFHYSLSAPGARPFLQCIAYQTRMPHSSSQFRIGN